MKTSAILLILFGSLLAFTNLRIIFTTPFHQAHFPGTILYNAIVAITGIVLIIAGIRMERKLDRK